MFIRLYLYKRHIFNKFIDFTLDRTTKKGSSGYLLVLNPIKNCKKIRAFISIKEIKEWTSPIWLHSSERGLSPRVQMTIFVGHFKSKGTDQPKEHVPFSSSGVTNVHRLSSTGKRCSMIVGLIILLSFRVKVKNVCTCVKKHKMSLFFIS